MTSSSWKKQVFAENPTIKPETRIRRQIDGIEKLLDLKFRNRVLDLGCGAGSQTIELARRRYRVVGMETSNDALATAREKAKAEQLTVHFHSDKMTRIPFESEFNAVLNLRNPLGCHKSDREDLRCLEAIRGSLRPGGRLLLDLLNREWIMRRLGAQSHVFDLRTGRLDCRGFRSRGGAGPTRESLRIYSLTEIASMLDRADLRLREAYGDYDGKPYGLDSQRMIVVAERGPERKKRVVRPNDGLERAVRIKGRRRG
jgi:SAM-dependent methyltransferase